MFASPSNPIFFCQLLSFSHLSFSSHSQLVTLRIVISLLSFFWLPFLLLALPIVIHLWNRRKAKRIAIGSIRHIPSASVRKWRRVRLSKPLLLLLRCFLVLMAAVLLMRPAWLQKRRATLAQTNVFISPQLFPLSQYPPILQYLDSLDVKNRSVRLLNREMNEIDSLNQNFPTSIASQNNWSLLRQIERNHCPHTSCIVFMSSRQASYKGTKPFVNNCLQTHILPSAKKNVWLESIDKLPNKRYRLLFGKSDAQKTEFIKHLAVIAPTAGKLKIPEIGTLQYRTLSNGTTAFHTKDSTIHRQFNLNGLPIQKTKRALIHHSAQRTTDARYLHAALSALVQVYDLPIKIEDATSLKKADTTAKYHFWLSSLPPPNKLLSQVKIAGTTLFCDMQGIANNKSATKMMQTQGEKRHAIQLLRWNTLNCCQTVLWETQSAEPVLCCQTIGRGKRYDFASRFHPAYTNLVESAELAQWLLPIITADGQTTLTANNDMRSIAPDLLAPYQKNNLEAPMVSIQKAKQQTNAQSLHLPIWLFLCALFVLERSISNNIFRKTSKQ